MGEGEADNGPEIDRWHLLLDELCNQSGDYDNARLGSELCRRLGKREDTHFETAVRNLRNWRAGRHIPRQRNFMILSELMNVQRSPALRARWNALYAKARELEDKTGGSTGNGTDDELEKDQEAFEVGPLQPAPPPGLVPPALVADISLRPAKLRGAALGLLMFLCGIGASELYRAEPWLWFHSGPVYPLIVLRPHVSIAVGESIVIHGERGDCGKLPPDWEYVLTRLPVSRIGDFSDGGIVRRNSNFCKGETPARAVVFTARRTGVEEFLVLGDVMRVTVTDAPL